MIKKILSALYILIIICLGITTIIEKHYGSDFVATHIYGAWWFSLLWSMLAVTAVTWMIKRKMCNWLLITLHSSMLIILAGAFITHITSQRGMIHLRVGESTDKYIIQDKENGIVDKQLPFSIKLEDFNVSYHDGTRAAADYKSHISIVKDNITINGDVAMNKIFFYDNIRFYQSSFDEDGRGSVLSLNSDPYGIPVTYTGYGLLFISLLLMLVVKNGPYRKLWNSELIRKGSLVMILTCMGIFGSTETMQAVTTLPKETAEKFGKLNILYNDRICPLQTFAIDFTKKLYGKSSYKGMTAEQVVTGWIFWGNDWSNEPIIKMKDGELKATLNLPDYVSLNTFFSTSMGGYIIGPYVQEYYNGKADAFHKQVASIDDKIQMIMELRRGTLLKIFPYTSAHGITTWYAPTDNLSKQINRDQRLFIQNSFSLLYQQIQISEFKKIDDMMGVLSRYQIKYGGKSIPSESQINAERIYNSIPFATILFIFNLTMGFLTLFYTIYRLTQNGEGKKWVERFSLSAMVVSFMTLTMCEILRWIISSNIPISNGYETMLFVAWLLMLLSLITYRYFHIVITFGFIMSGFFLLVSHINQMDPNISHIMPVLNSPLLCVHVSVIMISFALLSMTFICGIMGIILSKTRDSLQLLSRLFLYPALTTMGIGIFIGAIWANVSWGQYWSWDPKEVWALITFMIYAIVVHTNTLPTFRKPLHYHIFITLAFLCIIMTYFGVNYFLGGMHSYA